MTSERELLERLSDRVARLESGFRLLDLLGVPGILMGGARNIFDLSQSADQLADSAPGFFPLEKTNDGRSVRWTQYPDPGTIRVPVIANFPWRVRVQALLMPHIRTSQDVEVRLEGDALEISDCNSLPNNEIEFRCGFSSPITGLLKLAINSREAMSVHRGNDTRLLGIPFTKIQSNPLFLEAGGSFQA